MKTWRSTFIHFRIFRLFPDDIPPHADEFYELDSYCSIEKMYRFVVAAALVVNSRGSVEETWKRTDAALQDVNAKFTEVRKRADEAVAEEKKVLKDAKIAAEKSEQVLEHLGEPEKVSEENLRDLPVDKVKFEPESSFLEIPDDLKKFPGVEEDMKRAQEAERLFKEKMHNLHEKDEELMAFARTNFAASHNAVKQIGHLRAGGMSSFLQGYQLPPAFAKVREAQEELRKMNENLKKQFHLQ